ncbi:unnamed protein product [Camellia sinensis]
MAGFARAMSSSSSSSLVVLLLVFLASTSLSEAREFLVGGKTEAWNVPSSSSHHSPDSLNQWAESSRFLIGDSLVWNYDSNKDSVLQVSKRDYVTCNTSSPIAEYKDGNTKVRLDKAGPFYFISGAEGHCEKGQRLIVVVMSERHRRHLGIAPAPSPAEFQGPAIAPTSGATRFQGGLVVVTLVVLSGLGLMW